MPVQLNDLPFIDIYVRLDREDQAYYRSRLPNQGVISQFVPPEYNAIVARFSAKARERLGNRVDGSMEFEGLRCRLAVQKMTDDSVWVCARRINTDIPDLDKLGLQPYVLQHMKNLGRRDGLIIFSGATGAGKTTTAVALLAHFLKTFGGTAVTIEDPCEYTLAGRHGTGGQCFQIEAETDEDWALILKRSLRWTPRYIFVGEVRTPKAAEQLLRAASTGHLVITTLHSGTIEEALMGLIFLAEQALGTGVQNLLASSLTAMSHQTLTEAGPYVRYLYTEENSPGDPVRSIIREDKIGMLSTYIDRAAARLQSGTAGGASGRK